MSQFFLAEVARLCAAEIDPTAVAYLKRAFPDMRTEVNDPLPPLAYDTASFDVIYSWSVWTHLPEDAQIAWLREVVRILRPGGLALITTQGLTVLRTFVQRLRTENQWEGTREQSLLDSGFLYRDYTFLHDKRLLSGIEGHYGLAFHSPKHIRDTWSAYLEIVEIQEGAMHNRHDLVVARKRS